MRLSDKIEEFIAYRKAIKKPIRKESMDAFMKKLIKLSNGNEEDMIEILDNSIANSWTGIFELKDKKPTFKDHVQKVITGHEQILNQWKQEDGISETNRLT